MTIDNSKSRVHKHREKKRTVTLSGKNKNQRRLSLWTWGNRYFGSKFTLEPSHHHRSYVKKLEEVIRRGGNYAYCFPRGSAKTTWQEIACIWCMCEGIRRYICLIGGCAATAKSSLSKIKSAFESNDLLLADYPLICGPVRSIRGVAQRARMMQDGDGNSFSFEWKSERIRMPNVPGLRSAGYLIEALGIDSYIRGKNESLPNGESTRPDLVLMDDPQTREDATSPATVEKILNIIQGDVLGLAGPGIEIAALLAGTIISRNDVMDQLTDKKRNPSWHGVRVSMLESRAIHEKDLWLGEYARLRRESQQNEEEIPLASNEFYLAHRAEMDAGAVVYWPARYLPSKGEISAIQHAYNILIDKGESVFASEYQNAPLAAQTNVFELRPERIYAKLNRSPMLTLPPFPVTLTAGVDLNRYGLTWNLLATTIDLSSTVLAYGIHVPDGREKIYDGERNKRSEAEDLAFFKALSDFCDRLQTLPLVDSSGRPQRIRRVGIDAGYLFSVVRRFVSVNAARYPFDLVATRGRSASQFRPAGANVQKNGKDWIVIQDTFGALTVYNSDVWTESSQTGFLLPSGAPGAVDLWGDNKSVHIDYAAQICNQKLAEKLEGDKGLYYRWTVEGRNDYLDSLTIGRVMAGMGGADLFNVPPPQPSAPSSPAPPDSTSAPHSPAPVSYDPLNF